MAKRSKKDIPELVPESSEKSPRSMTVAEELEEERLRKIADEMTIGMDGTKHTPTWYKALMLGFMVIGLLWLMVFYITETVYPIPGINYWNIAIGIGLMMIGLVMTTRWR